MYDVLEWKLVFQCKLIKTASKFVISTGNDALTAEIVYDDALNSRQTKWTKHTRKDADILSFSLTTLRYALFNSG